MTNWQCLFNNHVLDVTKWFMVISCLNQLCMGGSWAQLERAYHISKCRCCAWVYIKGVMISIFSVNKSLHTLLSYTYWMSVSADVKTKTVCVMVYCTSFCINNSQKILFMQFWTKMLLHHPIILHGHYFMQFRIYYKIKRREICDCLHIQVAPSLENKNILICCNRPVRGKPYNCLKP